MFTKHSGVALLGSLSMLSTAPAARATDALPAAAALPAVAADTLIPIESFFENCSFSGAILSPDGRLAVCVAQAEFTRPGEIKNLALLRLYRRDLEKNRLDDTPLTASSDFDMRAEMLGGSGRPLGLRYETDAQWQLGLLLGHVRKLPPIRHARADRRPRQGCHRVQGHLGRCSRQRTSPNAAISAPAAPASNTASSLYPCHAVVINHQRI